MDARGLCALLASIAAVSLAWAPAIGAATKSYTSGPLHIAIRDGATVEQPIDVPDAGPVWHLAVGVRLEHARDSDLVVSLVAPDGTAVKLSTHEGGAGRNFGTGARNCSGEPTVFRDDADLRLSQSAAPFEGLHRPDERLSHLYGKQARGRWTLRITDDVPGKAGVLLCWQLDLSRNVLEIRRGASGAVRAELSYRERDFAYRDVRLRVLRHGKPVLDQPVPRLGCGSCPYWRPALAGTPVVVRDLDRDREPEIVVDAFTGGAHCCSYSVIYRYVRARGTYVGRAFQWGNTGYRLVDLDRDGAPEFSSTDDRFAYAFTSFVASFEPIRIWRYRAGRMVDVTQRFPGAVRRDAASLWAEYKRIRHSRLRDVRGVLAAWIADQYLLGKKTQGWRQMDAAAARGEFGRAPSENGYPAGRAYLTRLRAFLRRTGYGR